MLQRLTAGSPRHLSRIALRMPALRLAAHHSELAYSLGERRDVPCTRDAAEHEQRLGCDRRRGRRAARLQPLGELRIHLRRRLLLACEPHDREHVLLLWWQPVVGRRLVERRLALVHVERLEVASRLSEKARLGRGRLLRLA